MMHANIFYKNTSIAQRIFLLCILVSPLSLSIDAHAARRTSSTSLAVKSQPASTSVYEGQSTTFSISATSSSTITYTWYKNGVVIGSNSKSLLISNAILSNAGTYSCQVTDGTSTYTCNNFTLTVNAIVRITQQPSNQIINVGTSTSMSVAATGTAPIRYQWYFNGTAISGATSSALAINNALQASAGNYYCYVSNPGSNATSNTASLAVMAVTQTRSASVSWSPPIAREDGTPLPATDIAGYQLYHSNISAASMAPIATLSASDLSYVVTGLQQGTHYFAATAIDRTGLESALSSPVSITLQF